MSENNHIVWLSGEPADAGELDSDGEEMYAVHGGPHDGHTIQVHTEKHNCGAWGAGITCSCRAFYQSSMNGCWQQGHQRKEAGDYTLMDAYNYEIISAAKSSLQ